MASIGQPPALLTSTPPGVQPPVSPPLSPTASERKSEASAAAVMAALQAAVPGTVKALVKADVASVTKSFEKANAQCLMKSNWQLTEEYLKYLGMTGVVVETSQGAVCIQFADSTTLWFPLSTVAQFALPAQSSLSRPVSPPSNSNSPRHLQGAPKIPVGGMDDLQEKLIVISSVANSLPQSAVVATLVGLVEGFPQLADTVISRLQNVQLENFIARSQNSPMASSSLAARTHWNRQLDAIGSAGARVDRPQPRKASKAFTGDEEVMCHSRSDTGELCGVMRSKKQLVWNAQQGCYQCTPGFHCLLNSQLKGDALADSGKASLNSPKSVDTPTRSPKAGLNPNSPPFKPPGVRNSEEGKPPTPMKKEPMTAAEVLKESLEGDDAVIGPRKEPTLPSRFVNPTQLFTETPTEDGIPLSVTSVLEKLAI